MQITKRQSQLHMLSEGIALLVSVPWLFHVAEKLEDPRDKFIAKAFAYGTIAVDGYLFVKYARGLLK